MSLTKTVQDFVETLGAKCNKIRQNITLPRRGRVPQHRGQAPRMWPIFEKQFEELKRFEWKLKIENCFNVRT